MGIGDRIARRRIESDVRRFTTTYWRRAQSQLAQIKGFEAPRLCVRAHVVGWRDACQEAGIDPGRGYTVMESMFGSIGANLRPYRMGPAAKEQVYDLYYPLAQELCAKFDVAPEHFFEIEVLNAMRDEWMRLFSIYQNADEQLSSILHQVEEGSSDLSPAEIKQVRARRADLDRDYDEAQKAVGWHPSVDDPYQHALDRRQESAHAEISALLEKINQPGVSEAEKAALTDQVLAVQNTLIEDIGGSQPVANSFYSGRAIVEDGRGRHSVYGDLSRYESPVEGMPPFFGWLRGWTPTGPADPVHFILPDGRAGSFEITEVLEARQLNNGLPSSPGARLHGIELSN